MMLLVGAFILPSQGERDQSCLDSRPNIRPTNNSDAVLDGDDKMHPVHNKIGSGPRNLVNRKEHATEKKKLKSADGLGPLIEVVALVWPNSDCRFGTKPSEQQPAQSATAVESKKRKTSAQAARSAVDGSVTKDAATPIPIRGVRFVLFFALGCFRFHVHVHGLPRIRLRHDGIPSRCGVPRG